MESIFGEKVCRVSERFLGRRLRLGRFRYEIFFEEISNYNEDFINTNFKCVNRVQQIVRKFEFFGRFEGRYMVSNRARN